MINTRGKILLEVRGLTATVAGIDEALDDAQ